MKITLCNMAFAENTFGPLYHFPMGLLNIATVIKTNNNHCLSIVDIPWLIYSGDTPDDFINYCTKKIIDTSPEVVGFYTRCDLLPSIILVAQRLKEVNENIKVVFGGPGAAFVSYEILKNFQCVDLIILGEGEKTVEELCNITDLNNCSVHLKDIHGVVYRSNGQISKTKERELICDLNEIPLPDYSLINYYKNTSSVASLEAGRGCPYNCTFCSTSNFWRRKFRVKSPVQIVSEMKRLISDFGVKSITLIHDNLIVSPKFIKELTSKINENIPNAKWRCSGRVDNLNKDIIDMLAESGCESLYLGIETGSEIMQKTINKNLDVKNITKILTYCEKKGLHTWASFIIGFPNETSKDIDETIKLATDIRQYKTNQVVQLHVLSLDPGSVLFEENKDNLKFTNSFSDHALFVYNKPNNEYINLIKKYPSVFSSFYSLNYSPLKGIDLNSFCRCAKIFLDFYPKTLKVLFSVYNISPTKLISHFCTMCKNVTICESKHFNNLTCKLCENIESYIESQNIKFEKPYESVLLYEKETIKLLSEPYKEKRLLNKNNSNNQYCINNKIKVLKLNYNPFIIMNNIKSYIFDHKLSTTYLILIRTRLESLNTLQINLEIYNLINHLSSMKTFELNDIVDYYNITNNEAKEIIKYLQKHGIII